MSEQGGIETLTKAIQAGTKSMDACTALLEATVVSTVPPEIGLMIVSSTIARTMSTCVTNMLTITHGARMLVHSDEFESDPTAPVQVQMCREHIKKCSDWLNTVGAIFAKQMEEL